MSKQPPPAPTASAVGPCPTVFKIAGRPGTGSLPSTFAPPDHPLSGSLRVNLDRRQTHTHITGALKNKQNCMYSDKPAFQRGSSFSLRPFETVFQSIERSPRERKKEERTDRREKKCPNKLHPHLLRATYALALL